MKNAFAKRFQDTVDMAMSSGLKVGTSICTQQMMDIFAITLHERFGFGPQRIQRFWDSFSEVYMDFKRLSQQDNWDKTYYRAKLDEHVMQAVGEENFHPWAERYEFDFDPRINYITGKWEKPSTMSAIKEVQAKIAEANPEPNKQES